MEKRELKVRNPLEKFFDATPRGDDELDRIKFLTEGREQMVSPVDKNVLTRFTSEAVTLFLKPSFSRATKTLFSILVYNTLDKIVFRCSVRDEWNLDDSDVAEATQI